MGIMNWLYDWASKPTVQKRCIIEYKGKFWNGSSFGKRDKAKSFRSSHEAWAFVDLNFSEQTAEQIGIENV